MNEDRSEKVGKPLGDQVPVDRPQQETEKPIAEVVNLSQYIKDKDAGPWVVFTDPKTDAVNVAPMELIMNWACGEVEIDKPEHLEVVRTILYEWYNAKMSTYNY